MERRGGIGKLYKPLKSDKIFIKNGCFNVKMIEPVISLEEVLRSRPTRRGFLGALVAGAITALAPAAKASRGRCLERYDIIFCPGHSVDPTSLIGREAPLFHQQDVNINSSSYTNFVGPQDYRRKVVVVDFGDIPTCAPCRAEIPDLQRVHQDYSNDVQVLFVSTAVWHASEDPREQYEMWQADLEEAGIGIEEITFPLLSKQGRAPVTFCHEEDNHGEFWENFVRREGQNISHMGTVIQEDFYGVGPIPAIFVVDRGGIIRDYHAGRQTYEELVERVRPYL